MTVHDDLYNVKYRQPDILLQPVLFELITQKIVSHVVPQGVLILDFIYICPTH